MALAILLAIIFVQTTISDATSIPRAPCYCGMQKLTGPCRANIRRFYYNMDEKRCIGFTYGGCAGNNNNFETMRSCQKFCYITDESDFGKNERCSRKEYHPEPVQQWNSGKGGQAEFVEPAPIQPPIPKSKYEKLGKGESAANGEEFVEPAPIQPPIPKSTYEKFPKGDLADNGKEEFVEPAPLYPPIPKSKYEKFSKGDSAEIGEENEQNYDIE